MADYYVCNECNEAFKNRVQIIKHIRVHHDLNKNQFCDGVDCKYQCKHCGRNFTKEQYLETHIHCHHEQTILLPSRVNKSLNYSQDVGNDLEIKQEVFDEEPNCLFNLNTNTAENIYDASIKIEENDCQDVTTDDKCPSSSSTSSRDTFDNKQTTISQSIQKNCCNICNKNVSDLKSHVMMIHGGELGGPYKPHRCDVCDKSFSRFNYLKRHMMVHSGEKPHRCDVCDKRFADSRNLKNHTIAVHSREKPHKCDVCDEEFSKSNDLQRHMMLHNEENPHKCDVCDEEFSKSDDLQRHMMLHSGEKPHRCDICDKTFTDSRYLKFHAIVHSEEKPLRCDLCDKSYSRFCHLKIHKKLHHSGEKPHKCDMCDKKFYWPNSLRKHMWVHGSENR